MSSPYERMQKRIDADEFGFRDRVPLLKAMLDEYGVIDLEKGARAFEIAYEHGHSHGWWEVPSLFDDIAELLDRGVSDASD